MVHAFPRPLTRALGGLALAGLLTGGLAGGAQAADAPLPVTITGPEQVALSLNTEDDGTEPQIDLGLSAPDDGEHGPDEDGITYPVFQGDYTLTIDASELAGIADVTLVDGWACTTKGLVFVCTGHEIYPGDWSYNVPDLRLDVNDGSEAGESGTVKVTGEADGVDFAGLNIDVLVGQAELHMRTLAEPEGFAPGETYKAPLGFRNVGGTAASDGVVLRLTGSRGLSFPDTYSNCSYARTGDSPLTESSRVLCAFDGTFHPGAAYGLSEPFAVKTAPFALDDVFAYRFSPVTEAELDELRGEHPYESGTGAKLRLVEVADADPAAYVRFGELDFPTRNTYDLAFTGGSARGGEGDVVTVDVGFANNGPAWLGSQRAGGEPIGFQVEVPPGASVVEAPKKCGPMSQNGEVSTSLYLCWLSTPVLEDDERSFPFELRIDEVVENARGKVYVGYSSPKDGDHSNDTAWIVLNGPGDGSGTGGSGDSGSSGGSGDGDSGKGEGDGDGSTGGSGSADGSGGADGSGDGSGKDAAEGDLALTGAGGVLLLVGGSLVVLGAGVAVYWAARRRSTVAAG